MNKIYDNLNKKDKNKTDTQNETKSKNVFKIAFGSKLPSNLISHPASAKKKKPKVCHAYFSWSIDSK